MRVDDFAFHLPEDRIALRPVSPRDRARMLVINPHRDPVLVDGQVSSLPGFLKAGDAIVFNDTKVIPAQLSGLRRRMMDGKTIEAKVDVTLHKRTSGNSWDVFARPAKKLQIEDDIVFSDVLSAKVIEKRETGDVSLSFDKNAADLDQAIAASGVIPLPPYIAGKRAADDQDHTDYQTIFAEKTGAVAAPTAGLHTTDRLLDAIRQKGAELLKVTLHVGAGTFLPVKVDDTQDHVMHAEIGVIDRETADRLNEIRANGGRIISVGTTSLRLLESAVDEDGVFHAFNDETDIFITPGYKFRAVDILMTNFHLPRSTLFMLVSAFSGLDVMRKAYDHAINSGYRFYSYGDASLLWRSDLKDDMQ